MSSVTTTTTTTENIKMSKRTYKTVFGEENHKEQCKISKQTLEEQGWPEGQQQESQQALDLDDLGRKLDAALEEDCRRMDSEQHNVENTLGPEDHISGQSPDSENLETEHNDNQRDRWDFFCFFLLKTNFITYFIYHNFIIIHTYCFIFY